MAGCWDMYLHIGTSLSHLLRSVWGIEPTLSVTVSIYSLVINKCYMYMYNVVPLSILVCACVCACACVWVGVCVWVWVWV